MPQLLQTHEPSAAEPAPPRVVRGMLSRTRMAVLVPILHKGHTSYQSLFSPPHSEQIHTSSGMPSALLMNGPPPRQSVLMSHCPSDGMQGEGVVWIWLEL